MFDLPRPAIIETLAQFMEVWISRERHRIRGSTLHRYKADWSRYVHPVLGDRPFVEITPFDIQDLYDGLTDRGYAAYTVLRVHQVLTRVMQTLVHDEYITRNPCQGRTLPRPDDTPARVWSPIHLVAFLDAVKRSRIEAFWTILAVTGMRRGELGALRWQHVDLARQRVAVVATVRQDEHGTWFIGEGAKTKASNRFVVLPRIAIDAICRQRDRYPSDPECLVCPHWSGEQTFNSPHYLQYDFKRIIRKAGLPDIRIHDLRHTAATIMMAEGAPIKAIQEQLGHKNIEQTLNLYAHASEGFRRMAADVMDLAIARADVHALVRLREAGAPMLADPDPET